MLLHQLAYLYLIGKFIQMYRQLQMGLGAFLLFTSKIWSCICFVLKKQIRVVSIAILLWENTLVTLFLASSTSNCKI